MLIYNISISVNKMKYRNLNYNFVKFFNKKLLNDLFNNPWNIKKLQVLIKA